MVSPTHAEGDRITDAIRRRLKNEGLIGQDARVFTRLIPTHFTLGERKDLTNYQSGQVLVFHQNAPGFKKSQAVKVQLAPKTGQLVRLPIEHAERFSVYRTESIEVASGDRIRITRNGSTKDGLHKLANGDLFTVNAITPGGDLLVFKDGKNKDATQDQPWTIAQDFGHLAHGLVVTSHASQGKTVDRVLIGQSSASFAASSKEQFYVSASRGREEVRVFTDSKADLLDAVRRSDERLAATELVNGKSSSPGLDPVRRRIIRQQYEAQLRESQLRAQRREAEARQRREGQPHATPGRREPNRGRDHWQRQQGVGQGAAISTVVTKQREVEHER